MEIINQEIPTKEYSEYNTLKALKKDVSEELNLNEINIYPENKISEFDFKHRDFISAEYWTKSVSLQAQVLLINKNQITCECLIDKENRKFETRVFSKELFLHLSNLKIKTFVLITIRTKLGSSRIDVYDGKHMVNEHLFKTQNSWNLLENSGLDKPISFKDD